MVIPKKEGAAGVIIWGSSNDVNTEKKCRAVQSYIQNVLGPVTEFVLQTPKEEMSAILTNNIVDKPSTTDVGDNNSVDYFSF